MIRRAIALLAAVLGPAALAQPAPQPALETVQVAPSVYMLVGRGGNIGVSAGDDGVLLVDDQFAPVVPAIESALAGLKAGPVRFILNTHWHSDHTGGNEVLAGKGAVVVAHDNVRTRMRSGIFNELLQNAFAATAPGAWPVVTFNDELHFHLNGEDIHVRHLRAAHTDGDAIVHFRKADVIHAGDVFFNGLYPFIDRDSGGTLDGFLAAIDAILALANDDTRIIPGHGPLATRADLLGYRRMLAETSARVLRMMQDGRSLDEIVAARPNADYDARWAWSFITAERYLQMVYGLQRDRISPGRN